MGLANGGKSTTDVILNFSDMCYKCLNDKIFLLSVFLDFSKAFDTIAQGRDCPQSSFIPALH